MPDLEIIRLISFSRHPFYPYEVMDRLPSSKRVPYTKQQCNEVGQLLLGYDTISTRQSFDRNGLKATERRILSHGFISRVSHNRQ